MIMVDQSIVDRFTQDFFRPLINDLPRELTQDFHNFSIICAPCKGSSHLQIIGESFILIVNLGKIIKKTNMILKDDEDPRDALDKFYCGLALLFLKSLFSYNRDVHPEVVQDKNVHKLLHAFVLKRTKITRGYID